MPNRLLVIVDPQVPLSSLLTPNITSHIKETRLKHASLAILEFDDPLAQQAAMDQLPQDFPTVLDYELTLIDPQEVVTPTQQAKLIPRSAKIDVGSTSDLLGSGVGGRVGSRVLLDDDAV